MELSGERLDVERSVLQDLGFTAADVTFLRERSHMVIPYPARAMARASIKLGNPL